MTHWLKNLKSVQQVLLVLFFYLIVGFITYGNGLDNAFMLDDHAFFDEKMRNIKNLGYQFLPDKEKFLGIEAQKGDSYYRPLAHVIPMICYFFFRGHPVGYHVTNVILLSLACWMMFLFVRRISGQWSWGVLTGLFYLIHPISSVYVNYITASVFTSQIIFMLGSSWCVWNVLSLKDDALHDTPLIQWGWGLVGIVLYLLSIMCHETAMALPFYLVALCMIVKRTTLKQTILCLFPFFTVLVIYFIFRLNFSSLHVSILSKFGMFDMNVGEYFASMVKLVGWYIPKLFYPVGIVLIWAMPVVRDYVWLWIIGGLMMMSFLLYLIFYFWSQRLIVLGLSWFAIGFLPFSLACLFQPSHGPMIEPHWFTFSVIGFFVFLSIVVERIWQKYGQSVGKGGKKIFITIFLIVFFSWISISRVYNKIWSNEITYCHYWLKQSPEFSSVYFYLAKAYEMNRQFKEARYYYEKTLRLGYRIWMGYTNLGLIDLMENKWDSARQYFLAALKIDPKLAIAISNLGVIYFKDGDYTEAEKYFRRAVELNRFALLPRLNLAKTRLKFKDTEGAIKEYEEIIKIIPGQRIALIGLFEIYQQSNNRLKLKEICQQILAQCSTPECRQNCRGF